MATMTAEIARLRWNVLEAVRNRLGFTRDEAKRIFYQFRGKSRPEGSDPDPADEQNGYGSEFSQVVAYMQETSARLDSIEKDLDYLKDRVDKILERI